MDYDLNTGLERQLRGEEDEVLHAYQCSEGFWTIGVGRLIDKRKGGGISKAESAMLLHNDMAEKTAEVFERLPWALKLCPERQAVLVSMSFQLGIDGLMKFVNTLAAVQFGNYDAAAQGMMNSLWARQTPARAKRMADQMRLGIWQWKPGF